jgi:hypothetical protein
VILAALGFAVAAATPAPPAAQADRALLPPDGFQGAWTRSGDARVYSGQELYQLIDGGAEIFYELGFERATTQIYRAGDDEVGVELYRFKDPAAALGIYLARCGAESPAAGLADRHTVGRHQLLLVRERFFLVVDNLSGRAERANDLVTFAREIASRLPVGHDVGLLDLLPRSRRVPGSERLIRGPLGLETFIQLGEGDVLQLGGRVTAVAARYHDEDGDGSHYLLLAPYPDEAAASRAFRHVAAHLDPELRLLASDVSHLVLQDYAKRFATVALCGARLELTVGLARSPQGGAEGRCQTVSEADGRYR